MVVIFLVTLLLAGVRVMLPEVPSGAEVPRTRLRRVPGLQISRQYDRQNDERNFYIPAILWSYDHWPSFDASATSRTHKPPGYPLLMATVAKVVGLSLSRLRVVQMLLSGAISALLYGWLRRRWSAGAACLIAAPFLFSSFFIKDSAYLTTDNPALLCVLGALVVLLEPAWSVRSLLALAVFNSVVVTIRQDTLWMALPTLVFAGRLIWEKGLPSVAPWAGAKTALLGAAILIPFAVVGWLWHVWHGLVPTAYYIETAQSGLHLTPLAYLLSVVAIFWWPYLAAVHGWRNLPRLALERPVWVGGLVAAAVVLIANTAYDPAAGHWGGYLWTLATYLPSIAGRSLPFLLLAPLGGMAFAAVLARLGRENPWTAAVLAAGFAAWALSCMINPYVFHRYYELYALLFLIAAAAVSGPLNDQGFSIRRYAPLVALAGGQLAITVMTTFLSLFPMLRR